MYSMIKKLISAVLCGAVIFGALCFLFSCGEPEGEGYAKNPKKDIPMLCEIVNAGDLSSAVERFFDDAELSRTEEFPDLTFSGVYNGRDTVSAVSKGGLISLKVGGHEGNHALRSGYFTSLYSSHAVSVSYYAELDIIKELLLEIADTDFEELTAEDLTAKDGMYLVDGVFTDAGLAKALSGFLYDVTGLEVSADTVNALFDVTLSLGIKGEKLGAVSVGLEYSASKVGNDKTAESIKGALRVLKALNLRGTFTAVDGVLLDNLKVEGDVRFGDGSELNFEYSTRLGYGEDGKADVSEHKIDGEITGYCLYAKGGEGFFIPESTKNEGYYGDGAFSLSFKLDGRDLSSDKVAELEAAYKIKNVKYLKNGIAMTSGSEYDEVAGKEYSRSVSATVGKVDIAAASCDLQLSGSLNRGGGEEDFTLTGSFGGSAVISIPEGFKRTAMENIDRLIAEGKRYYSLTDGKIYPHSTAGNPFGYYAFLDEETGLYVCYSKFIYAEGESTPEKIFITESDPTVTPIEHGAKYVIVTLDGDKVELLTESSR